MSISALSGPPPLQVATAVNLRGMRVAEARAADAAVRLVTETALLASSRPTLADSAAAFMAAEQAAPNRLRALQDLHLAQRAYDTNGTALRGANAQSAALLAWTA